MSTFKQIGLACMLALPMAANAFSFTPGSYYASTGSSINQYSSTGALLGSITPTGPTSIGTETRGIAFGGDGNLYVVRNNTFGAGVGNAGVDVVDANGHVSRSYTFSGWIGGQISSGNIAFAQDHKSFYVGAGDGIYQFDVAGTTGKKIVSEEAIDIAVLPDGNLIAASDYSLSKYTADGALLSTVDWTIKDPKGLTKDYNDLPFVMLTDARGIAYDVTSNTTYVSMLGYSGGQDTSMNFKILALDGFSNQLKGITSYTYASDLFMTDEGLLVGSRSLAPTIFTSTLTPLTGPFSGPDALFVTALPVPEADSLLMAAFGALGVWAWAIRSKSRQRT